MRQRKGIYSLKKSLLLLLSLLPINNILAQNLVPNWSFEQYSHCPTTYTQIGYAIGWHPSYVDNCCGYQVEYLNACGSPGFQVPSSVWGYKYASTGVAYMAQASMAPTVKVNYRENIYTKLTSPLVPGRRYYVSMRACHATFCQVATNNDGVRFSTDTTFAVDNIAAVHSTNVISDTATWTTISGCYVADSAYTYVGVGNFFDDAHTTTTTSCPSCSNPYPGYFVDDISVIPMTIGGNTVICSGDTTILTASGGSSYLWSTGDTTSSITVTPTTTTTYSVTVINNSCNWDTSIIVTPTGGLNATISKDTSICSGNSITLIATGGTSYAWNNGATTSSISVSPTANSTYTVLVSAGKNCKDTTIQTQISINPPGSGITLSGNNPLCSNGGADTLVVYGATSYLWSTGSSSSSLIVAPGKDSSYSVIANNGGCNWDTTINVLATGSIKAIVTKDLSVCPNGSVVLVAAGGDTYMWSTGATTSSINVSPTSTSTYSVTIGAAKGCKDTTLITKVTVYNTGTVNLCCSASIPLTDSVMIKTNASGNYIWLPVGTSACDTCSSIYVKPTTNTTYIIETTTSQGCILSDSVIITIEGCGEVWIPNAFTPNGDKLNTTFYPMGSCIISYTIYVFNKWGGLIYQNSNSKPWNGEIFNSGNIVQEDTYVYELIVNTTDKIQRTYIGKVTVLK
jgi:gliding motility-associated-like protein